MSKSIKRLSKTFKPEHYDLHITLDKKNMTFSGVVTIKGHKTGRPNQRLVFHQKGLIITSASLTKHNKNIEEKIVVDRINHHKSYSEVRLHTKDTLYPGSYSVTMEFNAKITDAMEGLYPCYFTHDGKRKIIFATQFESHYAREVFPCIDEPSAKAIFQLTVTTDIIDKVLSNTPQQTIKKSTHQQVVKFEKTPIMSTYLLAFVSGELHGIEGKTKDGVKIASWASVAQPVKLLDFANSEAIKSLEFFTDYFNTPFPLSKCDQVALPDFEAGAMENWGMITYREIALLTDSENLSISSQQYVSMVVCHEMSHQWFGNLVTMNWWDDLWLNESFAGIMEHIAPDNLHPEWNQWEQYMVSDVVFASARDVYKNVQPVRVDVNSPDIISTLFDPAIVYTKGGRLIRMLIDYVGEPVFRNGLTNYFKKYSYKNTNRDNLWEALSEVSGKNIAQLMDPWLNQSGMPLVRVKSLDKNHVRITQQRLLFDETDKQTAWPIPLFANQKLMPETLDRKDAEIEVENADDLIINTGGRGHYIVRYDDKNKQIMLANKIASQELDTETRINVLNDLLLLAKAGENSITEALSIAVQCQDEPRDAVWGMLARVVSTASGLGESNKIIEESLKKLRCQLAESWYNKLGWDDSKNDDPNTVLLRQTMLGFMLAGEHPEVIKEASSRFNSVKSVGELQAEQRPLIIVSSVRHGDSKVIDKLLAEYKNTQNVEIQLAITNGLCESRDDEQIVKILEKGLGKDGFVRDQDIFRWFALMMRNRYTRHHIWDWLTKNWQDIEKRVGSKMFDDIPVYAAGPLNTPEWEKKYAEFFEPKLSNVVLERNIRVGMADIRTKVDWRKREEPKILEFLKNRAK